VSGQPLGPPVTLQQNSLSDFSFSIISDEETSVLCSV